MSPRNDPVPEWTKVSFLQLVAKIGSGTSFTVDDLVKQMDQAEKTGQDFRISHQRVNYVVPVDQIREYFMTHPRPTKELTLKEEVLSLRDRVKELEARLGEHGLMEPSAVFDEQPRFEKSGRIPAPSPSVQEPEIPVNTGDGKKLSIEEIQGDLLTDLRGKKPITRDDPLVMNAKPPTRPTV